MQIHFEDFRMMTESFGMQLDDDSLLALYYVNDPQGSGFLAYEPLVEQLLDGDYFSLFKGHVDNSQVGAGGGEGCRQGVDMAGGACTLLVPIAAAAQAIGEP